MKWTNKTPKQAIKLIKENTVQDHMYNISMNKTKTSNAPAWANELIIKVDNMAIDIKRIETKVDSNTVKIVKLATIVEQAHPELFN